MEPRRPRPGAAIGLASGRKGGLRRPQALLAGVTGGLLDSPDERFTTAGVRFQCRHLRRRSQTGLPTGLRLAIHGVSRRSSASGGEIHALKPSPGTSAARGHDATKRHVAWPRCPPRTGRRGSPRWRARWTWSCSPSRRHVAVAPISAQTDRADHRCVRCRRPTASAVNVARPARRAELCAGRARCYTSSRPGSQRITPVLRRAGAAAAPSQPPHRLRRPPCQTT